MKRDFEIDVLECPKCRSRMQRISNIPKRDSIRTYLEGGKGFWGIHRPREGGEF